MLFYRRSEFTADHEDILARYDAAVRTEVAGRLTTPLRMRDWELLQVLERANHFPRAARILDTGSFNTYLALYFAKKFSNVTASDLLQQRWQKSWLRRLHLAPNKPTEAPYAMWTEVMRGAGVNLENFDLTKISAADASFDCVISISVIEHIPQIESAIRELYRVLAPGGRLLITTDCSPEPRPFANGVRYFSRDELRVLFSDYPEVTPDEAPDFSKENWCYGRKNGAVVTGFIEIAKPA